ncbi:MAG: murein biosynthesis integral membrane protein MurJ [Dehalococcoidia bacterium]
MGGLAIAAAIVAFGFLGSRVLGMVRQVAIAHAFGASPELDAYWVAFRVPDLIFQLLAGATLGSAFIPVFARLYRRESAERAWRLASAVLNTVTVATAAACAVAFVLAPVLVPLLAPGLGEDIGRRDELIDKAVLLTRIMLLSPFLFAISGMVTGILNARQQFFLPALAPMLYNIAIIFGALVLAGPWGVEGLAVGVVIGSGLHLAVQVPGLVRERMRYQFVFDWAAAPTREVARLMGPRLFGLAAAQANFFITTTYFASRVGTGVVSNLTYAWFIMNLPVALFGMAFSTAVFPRLAELVAEDDLDGMTATVSRVLRSIMFLTVPSALGLAILAEPVTRVLLERGEFTAADTGVVAAALFFYCIGVVPMAGIEIHSRGFYALGDTRTPVALTVAGMLVNLVLAALLWDRFEHKGLAFALSAATWVEWALLAWLYGKRTATGISDDLGAIARFAFCAAVMTLFLAVARSAVDAGGQAAAFVTTVALVVAGALVYVSAAWAMALPELHDAFDRARSLLGRPPAAGPGGTGLAGA